MKILRQKQLDHTWLKAAVVGSLWASVEIIVGSFLHNLRIPFSGTFLTAFSVFLLIAFFQLWDDRGIIWRAGLICALMKSLSPSAVIIGPMVGIFSEALILWLFILIFGRNLVGYVIGGALAVASALLHKVFSLLILYGFDLVLVAEALYLFAARQFRAEEADPAILIWAVTGIYLLLGAVAAVVGYFTGKRARVITLSGFKPFEGVFTTRNELFSLSSKRPYSLSLLGIHLLLIVSCLWLLNTGYFPLSLPLCFAYISACFFWYRNSLRHLKKPAFWIQFALITLVAAFLLEGYSTGNYFSREGLVIGLKMNLRAFVIMTGFSALSVELKNPLIRSLLYDRGLASLYQSLSLAFSALPDIISRLPSAREIIRERKSFVSFLFQTSGELLERFSHEQKNKAPLIIITGNIGQGKTAFLAGLVKELKMKNVPLAGFIAPGIFHDGQKEGFWLEEIRSGERHTLASTKPGEGWMKFGHYYFDPAILDKGREWLERALEMNTGLVIIDEVGPLELGNQGWAPAIEKLCRESTLPQLWVVRKKLVRKASRKWNFGDVYIFDPGTDDPGELIRIITELF